MEVDNIVHDPRANSDRKRDCGDQSGAAPTAGADRITPAPEVVGAEAAPAAAERRRSASSSRKEKESLKILEELPTVLDLHHWLARAAQALVEATAYDDRADVAWFSKINDPKETFESFEDSGPERFQSLDRMLSVALQKKIKGGELGREIASKTTMM